MPSNLREMAIIIAFTVLSVIVVLADISSTLVRLMFTLPLVFLLPGYALTMALFRRHTLNIPERLVLSIGGSVLVVLFLGGILNWSLWGLQLVPWTMGLGGTTLGATMIALIREWTQPGLIPTLVVPKLHFHQGIMFILALVIASGSVVVAHIGAAALAPTFTQLWIVPGADPNQTAARIGVTNEEATTMTYRLSVEVNGDIVHEWPSIKLEPGEKWESEVWLSKEQFGVAPVETLLYRLDAPSQIYRRVVWKPGNPKGSGSGSKDF